MHHFATKYGFLADFGRKSHFSGDKSFHLPTSYTYRAYNIHKYDLFKS